MADQQLWQHQRCGSVSGPAERDADVNVRGAFEGIPADWSCPVCGAEKDDFLP